MAWDDSKDPEDLIRSSEWDTMVTDQKGRVVGTSISEVIADTAANLPAAGTSGRIFFETDTGRVLFDDGTSWVEIGLSESQISLGNLGSNSHSELSGITSDDHHIRPSAGTHMSEDASENFNVTEDSIDATNLDGSAGTSNQFLKTDGTSLSFASPPKGMTKAERQAFNDLVTGLARNDFEDNLSEMGYDGGFYDIFRNTSKISSQSDVVVSTLSGGDPNGKTELKSEPSYDIQNKEFSNNSLDLSGQGTTVKAFEWNNDGTKLFMVDAGNDSIYEYNLGTPYNITTASLNQSISVSSNAAFPNCLTFNDTGTKMYVYGLNENILVEYNLGTGFDISTATFNQTFDTSNEEFKTTGIVWNNDGTKLFIVGTSNNSAHEYNLSTAYDIATATISHNFDISNQSSDVSGIDFNDDGTKMYISDSTNNTLYQYNLGTGFDISTATFNQSADVSSESSTLEGLRWAEKGKVYTIDDGTDKIYSYVVSARFFSSGSFTTVSVDLSTDENGGLTDLNSWVVSQDANLPTNTDIQYTVRDENSNTATATQSDVDTEVDISNLTGTIIEIDADLSTTDTSVTPSLFDHSHHFQQ